MSRRGAPRVRIRLALRAGAALAALLAAAVSAPGLATAQAQTESETQRRLQTPNYARGGYYIALEGLYAIENSPLVGDSPDDDKYISSGGFQFRFGNRHNRWLGTEIDVIYIHTFHSPNDDFLAWGMTLAERLYMTRGRFQPYITAGAGFLSLRAPDRRATTGSSSSGTETGFAMTFGMGAEIYVTESFAITMLANYQLTVGGIKDHDFITAGIGIQLF